VRAWLAAHIASLMSAIRRLGTHPLASLFEVIVLGIALALPVGLYVTVQTVRSFAGRHHTEPEISVFLTLGSGPKEIDSVKQRLAKLEPVDKVTFISRLEASGTLRKSDALAEVLDALPENPLPDAFTVRLREADPVRLDAAKVEIAGWPNVALVQVDAHWARKVQAAVRVGQATGLLLGTLFGIAAVAITFNTVRLQMLQRRSEIELTRLIGATNGYIRRPFIYFGGLQGLLGGVAALAMVALSIRLLSQTLNDFSMAYGMDLEVYMGSPEHAMVFLAGTALLGGVAAWLAATRYLWARQLPRDE